mmetsp:Transcript_15866/g.30025  ORF Transcript_15866/g.30025 Transcript_15866/m.30025 type:complete len:89 (+) Transcript_15866:151-417(+)
MVAARVRFVCADDSVIPRPAALSEDEVNKYFLTDEDKARITAEVRATVRLMRKGAAEDDIHVSFRGLEHLKSSVCSFRTEEDQPRLCS